MSDNRILVAGVSYAARHLEAENVPPGYAIFELQEQIGKPSEITSSITTTYFGAGTIMTARREGEDWVLCDPVR